MKKGQILEGMIEKVEFPNNSIRKYYYYFKNEFTWWYECLC